MLQCMKYCSLPCTVSLLQVMEYLLSLKILPGDQIHLPKLIMSSGEVGFDMLPCHPTPTLQIYHTLSHILRTSFLSFKVLTLVCHSISVALLEYLLSCARFMKSETVCAQIAVWWTLLPFSKNKNILSLYYVQGPFICHTLPCTRWTWLQHLTFWKTNKRCYYRCDNVPKGKEWDWVLGSNSILCVCMVKHFTSRVIAPGIGLNFSLGICVTVGTLEADSCM